MKPKCFYCDNETLEKRDSYRIQDGKRLVRIKTKTQIIFYCYKCKRFCLMLKDDNTKTDKNRKDINSVLFRDQEV